MASESGISLAQADPPAQAGHSCGVLTSDLRPQGFVTSGIQGAETFASRRSLRQAKQNAQNLHLDILHKINRAGRHAPTAATRRDV